ncbi:MAG: ABC transporter substrate-binding protein, partial [Calditrichia bacterium]
MNMKSKKKVMTSLRYIVLFLAGLQFVLFPLQAAEYPQRIISLAPNLTEIIFKIGAGKRLVGRTDFCKYPA